MSSRPIRILIGVILLGGVAVLGYMLTPRKAPPNRPPSPESQSAPDALAAEVETTPPSEQADTRKPFEEGLLLVGDPAPAITASRWYRGEPISTLETGHVYLIDLWATWCAPCVEAIPHLSELQSRHADEGLRIIGVSIDEGSGAEDQVARFVDRRANDIAFDIALDTGQTRADWLDAAGQESIPTAFVVDREGTVVWVGNPTLPEGEFNEPVIDRVLREVLSDTYKLDEAITEARSKIEERRAQERERATKNALTQEMNALWSEGDLAGALGVIDRIIEIDPASASNLAVRKAEVLLGEMYRPEEATAFFREMMTGPYFDDDETLMHLATLFSGRVDPGEEGRLLAIEAASLVVRRNPEAHHIMTLAGAQYAVGDKGEALRTAAWARDQYPPGSPEHDYYDEYVRMYQEMSN